ncbi:MAG TPA: hypothetical protein VFW11_21960 [Cyclobacteriaceae bacterium]|nr:hypothetical protein [Cyclobacteriaceae bacterium]
METKEDQPGMLILFVKQCLLFGSKDRLFRFFGIFAWIDLMVMVYAIIKIVHPV